MRRLLVVVVAIVVVGVGVLGWHERERIAPSTTTSTTASTIPVTTTTALAEPPTVCVERNQSPTSGSATIPVELCTPWRAQDTWSGAVPSVYTTSLQIGADASGVTAYVAWMRTSSTDLALYPGYEGPGPTTQSRGPEMVPLSARSRLLATFNSGFYEKDGAAGFYANRTLYYPMIRGLATVVRYTNGTVDITAWSGGARPGANVVMARQNLSLLVDNGRATPRSADNALWGITLHGVADVWRTALGVDAQGNLFYVAAPAQTSTSLAQILVTFHAVRAMQLDINPEWPIFVTYAGAGAQSPSLFVPNPNQIAGRFLYSSTKDFFALYLSNHPGEAQPW